jgi:hypothetical protein
MAFETRKCTKKMLELIDESYFDKDVLIRDLLNWLSEEDVEEFYNARVKYDNDFGDEDEDHEDDYDGQPDEAQEWHDFDPDC